MQVSLVKARIVDIEPAVWRHLLVPTAVSLVDLHDVLQAAFEWDDQHPHFFQCDDEHYGAPALSEELGAQVTDDSLALLETFEDELLTYRYGTPQGWTLEVTVTRVLNLPEFPFTPYCIDGARGAPPEDADTVGGYERLVLATQSPEAPESGPLLDWLGDWDPEDFDLDEINEDLSELFE